MNYCWKLRPNICRVLTLGSKWAQLEFILICILILLLMQYCKRVRAKEDFFIVISHAWTDHGTGTCHITGGELSGGWGRRRKTWKQPNEFCIVSPLELKSKNKAECAAGCWLETVMKKEERKKMKEGSERPVGLEKPSGLTVGPSLIGRPVRAWMTTKQD